MGCFLRIISYNDKRVSAKEYLKVWCDHYFDMEYHYYNESDDRTNQFMQKDLCQWMGYSIIFENIVLNGMEHVKLKDLSQKDMEDLIEQFYISLRDDLERNKSLVTIIK